MQPAADVGAAPSAAGAGHGATDSSRLSILKRPWSFGGVAWGRGLGGASDGLNDSDLELCPRLAVRCRLSGRSDIAAENRLGSCLWPYGAAFVGVGCWWVRFGCVATALLAGEWLAGSHWRSPPVAVHSGPGAGPGVPRPVWQPGPITPRGSATAVTGRCTPPPNPNPGFWAAGHRIRSGRSSAESVQTNPRAPTTPEKTLGASVVTSGDLLGDGRCLVPPAASAS